MDSLARSFRRDAMYGVGVCRPAGEAVRHETRRPSEKALEGEWAELHVAPTSL